MLSQIPLENFKEKQVNHKEDFCSSLFYKTIIIFHYMVCGYSWAYYKEPFTVYLYENCDLVYQSLYINKIQRTCTHAQHKYCPKD